MAVSGEYKKELNINKKYMRKIWDVNDGPGDRPEEGVCNYFTHRYDKAGSQDTVNPEYIVQTYSVGNFDKAIDHMIPKSVADIPLHRKTGVSVHYIINIDGEIFQMVDDTKRAWADGLGSIAEKSLFNPSHGAELNNNMNSYGITIMCINDGKSPFTPAQTESNLRLTEHLCKTHDLNPKQVIGLADWANGRHIAPGPHFPWAQFASAKTEDFEDGFGIWYSDEVRLKPDPDIVMSYKKKPLPTDMEDLNAAFAEFTAKFRSGDAPTQQLLKQRGESLKEDLGKMRYEKVKANLSQVGYVGKPFEGDYKGPVESDATTQIIDFRMHFLGKDILARQSEAFGLLWQDSSDPAARMLLGTWDENCDAVLNDLLS